MENCSQSGDMWASYHMISSRPLQPGPCPLPPSPVHPTCTPNSSTRLVHQTCPPDSWSLKNKELFQIALGDRARVGGVPLVDRPRLKN